MQLASPALVSHCSAYIAYVGGGVVGHERRPRPRFFKCRLFAAAGAGMLFIAGMLLIIVAIVGFFGLLALTGYVCYLAPRPHNRLK
jgi:hypothetical protein